MTESAIAPFDKVTMFGAGWCSDCRRSKALLDTLAIDYDYIDVEENTAAADRALAISGRTSIPLIVFPDAEFQVEPSDADLKAKLEAIGAF
ncbi:MAG: glutaredoxin family protein [Glaciihabitans sp.]|jgi:glutaredoxin|nr:glutaredoxin family protein [Glaciihabitans sp.]MDQ1529553.1 mycoredoxin [Actinomycetota bacterium]